MEVVLVFFFSVLLLWENVNGLNRVDPLVETKVGVIRGVTASDGDYAMFMGIPYAKINDTNPFGETIPFPAFEEVFEAFDDSAKCPQLDHSANIVGTLDCLHVNIYVPSSATSTNLLPVMVWIHGGFFTRGSAGRETYGPRHIVKHDVILVTLNYRLDAYGFMCLDIPEVPGNQGLKDQFNALKWINNNIKAFGGDINKITLYGQSAGGHSVDLHLLSLKEKMYNHVLIQSGSSVAATVLYEPDKLAPIKIAQYLGYETSDINESISYLVQVDTHLVTEATVALGIIFKPCVEKEFDGVESFISKPWINTRVPNVKDVPVLIGFVEHEMAQAHSNKESEYFKHLDIVQPYINRTFDFDDEELAEMKTFIDHFYFGDEDLSENSKLDIINFDSDYTYIHPIQRTIRNYLESEAGDIFYYMFSFIGGLSSLPNLTSHSDDMWYIFDRSTVTVEPSPEDQQVIDRLTTMWTNFAKYGDPTPETSVLLPVKWLPLTKEVYHYLHIDKELALCSRPLNKRMAFWDLFYKLNERFQTGFEEI